MCIIERKTKHTSLKEKQNIHCWKKSKTYIVGRKEKHCRKKSKTYIVGRK
jgi:hypothetical protein